MCDFTETEDIFQKPDCYRTTIPDSIKDIEWVGECDRGECINGTIKGRYPEDDIYCHKCNGTGTITRPTTLEERNEVFPKMLESLIGIAKTHEATGTGNNANQALTINGGTLRLKEEVMTTTDQEKKCENGCINGKIPQVQGMRIRVLTARNAANNNN